MSALNRIEELTREGWEKQSTLDEPRLSEVVQTYQEIGFEVLLEPFCADERECTECMKNTPENFKTVFVRKKVTQNNPAE